MQDQWPVTRVTLWIIFVIFLGFIDAVLVKSEFWYENFQDFHLIFQNVMFMYKLM